MLHTSLNLTFINDGIQKTSFLQQHTYNAIYGFRIKYMHMIESQKRSLIKQCISISLMKEALLIF